MIEQPLDLFHFFIFVIPGFITVWSFRHFIESKEKADFEYFALSVFWGLVMLLLYGLLSKQENFIKLLKNPYFGAVALSILGALMGWIGSILIKMKCFQKLDYWFKNFRF